VNIQNIQLLAFLSFKKKVYKFFYIKSGPSVPISSLTKTTERRIIK